MLRLNHRERFQVGPLRRSKQVVKSNKNITVAGFQSVMLFFDCLEQRVRSTTPTLEHRSNPSLGNDAAETNGVFARRKPKTHGIYLNAAVRKTVGGQSGRIYPSHFSLPSFSAIDSCDCPGLRKNAAPNAARISYNSQALYGWYK